MANHGCEYKEPSPQVRAVLRLDIRHTQNGPEQQFWEALES